MSEHAQGRPDQRRQATASQYRFRAVPTMLAELQRALLPASLPVLPRARFAARYQAARDREAAGGGWFDAIPLSDGTVAMAVGDVAGCGVAAAAAMGQLRAVLGDQLAVRPDLTAALERAEAYAQRTPELLAATMVLAQLSPADGSLRYATCGSPPPLRIGATGGARFLDATGTGPLGTGSDLIILTAGLSPGDFLLLCTDGLIQRPGSTVADGMTELAMAAGAAATSRPARPGVPDRDIAAPGPDQLCRRTVELMSHGGYPGDVTTLAVHVTADPAAALSLSLPAREDSVLEMRRAFSGWLTGIDPAVRDRDDLMLAVVETVTNAVEHAYPPGHRGVVEFRAALGEDGTLECQVTDHGRWRPPDPAAPYRGHGLMVAGQVVDQILVSTEGTADGGPGGGPGTVVTLRHRLGRPPSVSTDVSQGSARPSGISFRLGLGSDGAVPRASVSGAVDSGSAERLGQRLLAACRGGTLPLVLDLAGVTYLASSAVRVIYQVRELLTAHKQDLTIVAPSGSAAAELLGLVRLPHVSGEPWNARAAGSADGTRRYEAAVPASGTTLTACPPKRAEGDAMAPRPPLPPFSEETARQKVQAAEDAWNTRDPERVAGAYTEDSVWRNRDEFLTGRAEIVEFLRSKWNRELDYALRKDLWAFAGSRIAVRFQYECHDAAGQWYRCYGNELWEFDDEGLMRRREASINDVPITEADRRIFGPRPESERGQPPPLR